MQLNVLLPLTQVPPFRHGLLEHSSKSEEGKFKTFSSPFPRPLFHLPDSSLLSQII